MPKYFQGRYKPDNPSKYKGDPTQIEYRSRWEFLVMSMLDSHKDVLEWGSETVIIPYKSPIDNRKHRYFVDFYVKKKNYSDGKIEKLLIEVKPKAQTVPPKVKSGKKPSKRYLNEVRTWGVNSAKWEAANNYCKERGYRFVIFTEDDIGI